MAIFGAFVELRTPCAKLFSMKKALLIVDHGSTRAEANEMLKDVADVIQQMRADLIVKYAHMELAAPTIAEGFEACVKDGAGEVIVHPYMLSPGRHATSDIPRMVSEAAAKFPGVRFSVTQPLGVDKKIGEVVLERAKLT